MSTWFAEVLNPLFYMDNTLYGHPLLYFFPNPHFLQFFWQYLINEILSQHKNKYIKESYFFMFGGYPTVLHVFI